MLKWVGAGLVIIGCGLQGLDIQKGMKKELRVTEGFIETLAYMKEEMRYSKVYLEEVFHKCAEISEETKSFFAGMEEALKHGESAENVISAVLDKTPYIQEKVKQQLEPVFGILGAVDTETQDAMLKSCIEQLKNTQLAQEEALRKKGSFYAKIGFVAGVLTVILLF